MDWNVAQVHLLCKWEALTPNPSPTKKKEKYLKILLNINVAELQHWSILNSYWVPPRAKCYGRIFLKFHLQFFAFDILQPQKGEWESHNRAESAVTCQGGECYKVSVPGLVTSGWKNSDFTKEACVLMVKRQLERLKSKISFTSQKFGKH
jgi:hypothetical protein